MKTKQENEPVKLISCNHNGNYEIKLQQGKEFYTGKGKKIIFAIQSALEKIIGREVNRIDIEFSSKNPDIDISLAKEMYHKNIKIIGGASMINYIYKESEIKN